MLYTETHLDRSTGDLITREIGDWITVTEFGRSKGLGPRQVRRVLHHAGLLAPEGRHGHFRLLRSMVAQGMGKRHDRPAKGFPFDVLSPACQALLHREWDFLVGSFREDDGRGAEAATAGEAVGRYEEERKAARMSAMDGHGRVLWLADHFPELPQRAMGEAAGVAQQNVSKYLGLRKSQRDRQREGQRSA